MPTINTEAIEGFAEMTAEQKVEALLKLEVPEKVDMSGLVSKALFDKTASELAEAKKQVKARMTEDEAAKAESEKAMKDLQDKYTELLHKSTVAEHTARFLGMPGYDEKLAKEAAKALADNNTDKLFEAQQKAAEAAEKKLKAELLKNTPKPDGAGGGDGGEDENVKRARERGKLRAASMNASNDVMKHYL